MVMDQKGMVGSKVGRQKEKVGWKTRGRQKVKARKKYDKGKKEI
jgi:hypothetical protein